MYLVVDIQVQQVVPSPGKIKLRTCKLIINISSMSREYRFELCIPSPNTQRVYFGQDMWKPVAIEKVCIYFRLTIFRIVLYISIYYAAIQGGSCSSLIRQFTNTEGKLRKITSPSTGNRKQAIIKMLSSLTF